MAKKENGRQTLPPQVRVETRGRRCLPIAGDAGDASFCREAVQRTVRELFFHFFMSKAALPHLQEGSAIIHTTSVTVYRGSQHLMDYAATRAATVGFPRSLSTNLAPRKIRVNGVAPGPIWTPLIPASFPAEEVKFFGGDVPLGRPGQPEEVAPCFVFLASEESSYLTGQVLHPNGGEVVNG